MRVLALNAGSTSLKAAVFEGETQVAAHQVAPIGPGGAAADHGAALDAVLAALGPFDAVGHRVVHGGAVFAAPARVDTGLMAALDDLSALAPLHNPPALAAIRALAARAPDLPQVACFDTAFHAAIPEATRLYALPDADRAAGLRRYGFHGISYAGLVRDLTDRTGALPRRLLALHLGGGASACAILDGKSRATTMGYSPVSGLPMGTRAGDIDALAVLELARRHGIDGATRVLTREAGLMALAGTSDWRAACATPGVFEHMTDAVLRQSGAMIAAMGGIDALAFTGGIGENDARFRDAVMAGLGWTGLRVAPAGAPASGPLHDQASKVQAWVVPAREEATLARLTAETLAPGGGAG